MKNILIGVTGGISAYKSANIISILKKRGYNVKVVMTKNATKIITPLTLETLARNKVYVDMWESYDCEVEHISLAEWADIILVTPATYNIIGKVANGIADDMLSTVISAAKKPVYFALAMNVNMYENKILQNNIEKLKQFGYNFIEADEGFLACNTIGKGRLKDEKEIVDIIELSLSSSGKKIFLGKNILITAGRTEEAIDPIRYISNNSSGKMGYALAEASANLGANVTLITGPTALPVPPGLKEIVKIKSALEMYKETITRFDNMDIVIACAAVADYRPKRYSREKIKKNDGELTITLERNPDILFELGKLKNRQILIGFAAETNNIIENAKSKLKRKNLDMIVANDASNMQKSTNKITIIKNHDFVKEIPEKSKIELAFDILNEIS